MRFARKNDLGAVVPMHCKRALKRHSASFTPHDRALLQQVVGEGGTETGYLYGGFTVAMGLRAALHSIGKNIYDFTHILDFGCSAARVLRWLQDVQPKGRLYGCDLNPAAITWCQEHISFAQFTNNGASPPLPFSGQTFDFISGISVLTHLDEGFQLEWLQELQRLTKPGGIVMLTIHG